MQDFSLKDIFKAKKKKPVPEPEAPVTPGTDAVDSTPTEMKLAKEREVEKGFTHASPITATLTLNKITSSNIYFTPSARSWPEGTEKGCHGEAHLFVKRNGKWLGGKFDHIRNNSTSRDFNNLREKRDDKGKVIKERYGVFKQIGEIQPGEEICVLAIRYDKKERTNAAFAVMK